MEAWFFGGTRNEHLIIVLTELMVKHLYNQQLPLLLVRCGSKEMRWLEKWVGNVNTTMPCLHFTLFFPSKDPLRFNGNLLGKWHFNDLPGAPGAHTRRSRVEMADVNGDKIFEDDFAIGVISSPDGVECFDAFLPNQKFIEFRDNAIRALHTDVPKDQYAKQLDYLLSECPNRHHALVLRRCVDEKCAQMEIQRQLLSEKVL